MTYNSGGNFSSKYGGYSASAPSDSFFKEEVLVIIMDVNWQNWIYSIFEGEVGIGKCEGVKKTTSSSPAPSTSFPASSPSSSPPSSPASSPSSSVFPPPPPVDICSMCSAVFQFLRAYGLLSSLRRVAIIAAHSNSCEIIFEGYLRILFNEMESESSSQISQINSSLWNFIEKSANTLGDSILATAVSTSLCYINKVRKESGDKEGRIIIIDCSNENAYSSQYIPLMNCAFTAAKNKIIIDTCAVSTKPATIPEQLSHITGGLYLKLSSVLTSHSTVDAELALTQLLLFHFLPYGYLRDTIASVTQKNRANSAVCFCHNKLVTIPTVCSCCLAIYCSEKDDTTGKDRLSCQVCKARFTKDLIRNKKIADVDLTDYS